MRPDSTAPAPQLATASTPPCLRQGWHRRPQPPASRRASAEDVQEAVPQAQARPEAARRDRASTIEAVECLALLCAGGERARVQPMVDRLSQPASPVK